MQSAFTHWARPMRTALACLLAAVTWSAVAQEYPAKPIVVVVSFSAGGNVEMATMTAKVRAAFLGAYREALRALRSGVRDVFFPLGTWR